jgi:hypothetical protein
MIRILGNSPERVEIKDLHDFIYYRQLKDYTDQEYEESKDLKREIGKGRLAKIETIPALRGSVDVQVPGKISSLEIRDLKAALREVLPEFKGNGISEDSLKSALREIAPLIVDMVRQEVSKISITGVKSKPKTSTFIGPEYIPDISIEGMKESVKPKERKVTADDVADNLAALRKLKKNKSK